MSLPRRNSTAAQRKVFANSQAPLKWSPCPDFTKIVSGPSISDLGKKLAIEVRSAEYQKHGGFQSSSSECKPMRMAIVEACDIIERCGRQLNDKMSTTQRYSHEPYQTYLTYLTQLERNITAFQSLLHADSINAMRHEIELAKEYVETVTHPHFVEMASGDKPIGPLEMDLWGALCSKLQSHIALHSGQILATSFYAQTNKDFKIPNALTQWWLAFREKHFIKKYDIYSAAYIAINKKRRTYQKLNGNEGVWELVIYNSISRRLKEKMIAS